MVAKSNLPWIHDVPHGPIKSLIKTAAERSPDFLNGRWGLRIWTRQGPVFLAQLLVKENDGVLHCLFGYDERKGEGVPSMFYLSANDVLTAQLIDLSKEVGNGPATTD